MRVVISANYIMDKCVNGSCWLMKKVGTGHIYLVYFVNVLSARFVLGQCGFRYNSLLDLCCLGRSAWYYSNFRKN